MPGSALRSFLFMRGQPHSRQRHLRQPKVDLTPARENPLVIANTLFQQPKRRLHDHHQMVNTEIRLILFFIAKDGEKLYTVSKNKTGS